jgi:hypothetical protein
MLFFAGLAHSPVWDEPGHLVAGISHLEFGTFDLMRVNPPLVRTLALVPVILASPEYDWRRYDANPGVRSERSIRGDFIEANESRVFWLHTLARWGCIPFGLLGAYVCLRWATDLYGRSAGLLALTLWCFSPNVLAYGSLILPDVDAAAFAALAAYAFWRWLQSPSWTQTLLAGLVLGLAELTKFTLVVFFPLWPAMWIVWRLGERKGRQDALTPGPSPKTGPHPSHLPRGEGTGARRAWRREAAQLGLILLLAVYVINVGYGFESSLKPLGDYQFVSETFGGPEAARDPASARLGNRFSGTWLHWVPVPLPANYLMGIDIQRWDFEQRMWSYLRGEWRLGGWWYYYLYALAIKVPLGTWVLIGLALGVSVFGGRASVAGRDGGKETGKDACPTEGNSETGGQTGKDACHTGATDKNVCPPGAYSASWRDEMVLLAPLVVILTLVSSQTGFNHHLRYVLPIFPFAFIWTSKVARAVEFGWARPKSGKPKAESGLLSRTSRAAFRSPLSAFAALPRGVNAHRVVACVAAGALAWSVGSSLYYYPHSLSYFNELVGGPTGGHYHLDNSNIDWGQDLLYLKRWYDQHPEARPLGLAHFCPVVDPRVAGIEYTAPPPGPDGRMGGSRESQTGLGPQPGWYAISVNELHRRDHQYDYFLRFEPVAMAGYSIYIYHVTLEEANRVRRELGGKDEG